MCNKKNPDFVIIRSKKKMVIDIKMQLFEYALLFWQQKNVVV